MDNLILTDYIFLFIAFVSTIFGFARGFLREVFTILNLTLAMGATALLFPTAVTFFSQHLKDELSIKAAAFVGSFILCWVVIAVINSFVIDALKFIRGGFIDRIMGIALGLLRGALIVVGIYLGTVITLNAQNDDSKLPAWLRDAKSLNYVKVQSEYVIAILPKQYQDLYKNQNSSLGSAIAESSSEMIDTTKTPQLNNLGFDAPKLETLQELLSNVDGSLKVEDLDAFSPETIKMIGEQAVSDYEKSGANTSAKGIAIDKIKEVKEQLSKIKIKDAY